MIRAPPYHQPFEQPLRAWSLFPLVSIHSLVYCNDDDDDDDDVVDDDDDDDDDVVVDDDVDDDDNATTAMIIMMTMMMMMILLHSQQLSVIHRKRVPLACVNVDLGHAVRFYDTEDLILQSINIR